MNCQDFQAAVGAEPNSTAAEVVAHAAECAACARYQQELQAMDRLIHRALSVEIEPVNITAGAVRRPLWRRPVFAMAASLLATVSLATLIWIASSRDTFAAQIVDHIYGEAFSLVSTSETVSEMELAETLAPLGLKMRSGAGQVSYAATCMFRGHRVPHLVVQTEQGPITVLILTEEPPRTTPEWVDEGGFKGVILPARRGVIAVMGRNVPVDGVARNLPDALEYLW